ncbi:MAG: hypothetical protein ACHQQS_02915 [Thermoanaerobaculales bacterium]
MAPPKRPPRPKATNQSTAAPAWHADPAEAAKVEAWLRDAEAEALAILASHTPAMEAAAAKLDPNAQMLRRALGAWLVEHEEPARAGSRLKPQRCRRCAAADHLLVDTNEIRLNLKYGYAELAVRYALRAGHIRLRLALSQMEADAAVGEAVRAGGAKRAAVDPTRADSMQAFVDGEHTRDPRATWPELQRLAARHFGVCKRTVRRNCRNPHLT